MAASDVRVATLGGIARARRQVWAGLREAPLTPMTILLVTLFFAIFGDLVAPHDPEKPVWDRDTSGIFARPVWGSQVTVEKTIVEGSAEKTIVAGATQNSQTEISITSAESLSFAGRLRSMDGERLLPDDLVVGQRIVVQNPIDEDTQISLAKAREISATGRIEDLDGKNLDPEELALGNQVKEVTIRGGDWTIPLGTDFQGRDVLSRLIGGARISLIVALIPTFLAGVVGVSLGIIAGYMGRVWDQVIMRITDAKLALPSLIFAIFLATLLGPSLRNIIIVLLIVFWTRYARVIRGEVLSLREREFVKLAEVNGASKIRIMYRHLLPNVLNTAMVLFSLTIGIAIILEASLSFLGVGVPPPTPTWGNMLADARALTIAPGLFKDNWILTVAPGTAIALMVLAANLFGDWLRVRLDPQLRNR